MPNKRVSVVLVSLFLMVATNCSSLPPKDSRYSVIELRLQRLLECLDSAGVDRNKIYLRDSGNDYTELNFQWNTLNGYLEPLAYLVATTVSEIQKAVICSRLASIRIVPRSGGHSYVKNGFGDSRSLVVDLAPMNQISLNRKKMQCEVGPGARNGQISYAMSKDGFMVAQGICPTVGISGLTLGGGYGHFSRLLGLTSDNLIEAEMVDADGRLLLVNNITSPDLFWALRGGGGGNFGIVTKFKFKMYSAPRSIIYGRFEISYKDFVQFYTAYQKLISSGQPRNIFSVYEIEKGSIKMRLYALNGENVENMSVDSLKRLYKTLGFPVPTNKSIESLSHSEFIVAEAQGYSNVLLTHPSQVANMTRHNHVGWKKVKSIFVRKILTKEKIFVLKKLLDPYLKHACYNAEFFGGAVNDVSPSETAFIHRSGNFGHIQLKPFNSQGEEPNLDADSAMKTFYEASKPLFEHRESYQNYLDSDIRDYLPRYYGSNLKKLVQVKKLYDPENIFRHPESIPV